MYRKTFEFMWVQWYISTGITGNLNGYNNEVWTSKVDNDVINLFDWFNAYDINPMITIFLF